MVAQTGILGSIQLLLQHRQIQVDSKDGNGKTVADISRQSKLANSTEILQMLTAKTEASNILSGQYQRPILFLQQQPYFSQPVQSYQIPGTRSQPPVSSLRSSHPQEITPHCTVPFSGTLRGSQDQNLNFLSGTSQPGNLTPRSVRESSNATAANNSSLPTDSILPQNANQSTATDHIPKPNQLDMKSLSKDSSADDVSANPVNSMHKLQVIFSVYNNQY